MYPFLAEQAPFLQTYNGTDYYHDDAAKYIKEMNLQRGKWRDDIHNDFLGYDPPNETVYTGISGNYYCLYFFILYLCQTVAIFILKKKLSSDFRNSNIFDQFLHSAESTNFAFAMNAEVAISDRKIATFMMIYSLLHK